jgi:hypothetical protein
MGIPTPPPPTFRDPRTLCISSMHRESGGHSHAMTPTLTRDLCRRPANFNCRCVKGLHTSSTEISRANLHFLRHNVFRHNLNGSSPHSKQTYPSFDFFYFRYVVVVVPATGPPDVTGELRCPLPKRFLLIQDCGTRSGYPLLFPCLCSELTLPSDRH